MIIFDSHSHSTFSHDAKQTMEEQCETAYKNGFLGLAVTDHCELSNRYWNSFCKEHIPQSIEKAKALKEIYKDKLIIAVGVELGEALYNKEKAQKIIEENKLDFVLCSCHSKQEGKDYSDIDFSDLAIDYKPILSHYFEMLEATSRECDYDSLAHITYPIRYIQGDFNIPVDLTPYNTIIEKILINIIKNDRAMEVNASGYRQPLGFPMPHGEIIQKYKDLGGKLITLGSDAHRTEHMGKDIDKAMMLIKSCGFDRYYYYINRKPNEILI